VFCVFVCVECLEGGAHVQVCAGVGLWSHMPSTMRLRIITLSFDIGIVKREY
jgi:hypothetical protein